VTLDEKLEALWDAFVEAFHSLRGTEEPGPDGHYGWGREDLERAKNGFIAAANNLFEPDEELSHCADRVVERIEKLVEELHYNQHDIGEDGHRSSGHDDLREARTDVKDSLLWLMTRGFGQT